MLSYGKSNQLNIDILNFCENVATQSRCLSRHVGACLVKNGIVLSTGFNRVPNNTHDCRECIRHISGKNLDICKAIHAEEDCIFNFLKKHTLEDIKDCTLYVSVAPCYNCAKLIVDLGIKKVYAAKDYNSNYTKAIFDEAKVDLIIL